LPIEIETPTLRTLRVSGVFAADDTDSFIVFLRSLEGVGVEVTSTRIRVFGLSPRNPPNRRRTLTVPRVAGRSPASGLHRLLTTSSFPRSLCTRRLAWHRPVRRLLLPLAMVVSAGLGTIDARSDRSCRGDWTTTAGASTHSVCQADRPADHLLSDLVTARRSKGARAGLSPVDALTQLLDGTGLAFELLNVRTVKIFAVSVAPAPAATPVAGTTRSRAPSFRQREEIIVTGPRARTTWHCRGHPERRRLGEHRRRRQARGTETRAALRLRSLPSRWSTSPPSVRPACPMSFCEESRRYTQAAMGAYYLDDTPIGPSGPWANACCEVLDLMPYDLERLEVRRGPQGTRYGANSTSGLIRFVLTEPQCQ
jgi:hypothetical protein